MAHCPLPRDGDILEPFQGYQAPARQHLPSVRGEVGQEPYRLITRKTIAAASDKRAATPAQARNFDAVTVGRQHVRDGVIALKTEKTGTEVYITLDARLAEALRQGPTGDLAFIADGNGRPLTKETFGNYFREACSEADVKKSAHGLRKLSANVAAESGCTVRELEARYGWTGETMASLYIKSADRKRLARAASGKNRERQHPKPGFH